MQSLIVLSVATLLSAGQTPKPIGLPTLSASQIYEKYSKSVVSIETDTARGTGFFDADGDLYTAFHVIAGAKSIKVKFHDGKIVTARFFMAADASKDIAILLTDYYAGWEAREKGPPLGNFDLLKVGEPVFVVGSPLGLEGTLTEGMVSAKRKVGDLSLLQLSAAIEKGSSGSPVLNAKGQVVGMVTSKIPNSQGLNFAVGSNDLDITVGVPLEMVAEGESNGQGSLVGKAKSSVVLNPLVGLNEVSIVVEDIPDALTPAVLRTEVEEWVAGKLADAGVKVISLVDQLRKYDTAKLGTDAEVMKANDDLFASVHVSIGALKQINDTISYRIKVGVKRAALISPGFILGAEVWSDGTHGYFGSANDRFTVIRRSTHEILDRMVDKFKAAKTVKGS